MPISGQPVLEVFSNGELNLEIQYFSTENPKTACFLFAPYPPMGGTMSFPLIRDLFYELSKSVDLVCRFNYRGIGRSTGHFSDNDDGVKDGKLVIEYLLHKFHTIEIISLVGYSYGSAVISSLFKEFPIVEHFIGISPPFSMFPELFSSIFQIKSNNRFHFYYGDKDQFTSISQIDKYRPNFFNGQFNLIKGMDHFWNDTNKILKRISKIFQISKIKIS